MDGDLKVPNRTVRAVRTVEKPQVRSSGTAPAVSSFHRLQKDSMNAATTPNSKLITPNYI